MLSHNTVSKSGFCCNLLVDWKGREKSNSGGSIAKSCCTLFSNTFNSFIHITWKGLFQSPPFSTRQTLPSFLTLWYKIKQCKGKGKFHPRTGQEDPEGEYRYNSTLSLTSALDGGGWWSRPRPSRFAPGKDLIPIA